MNNNAIWERKDSTINSVEEVLSRRDLSIPSLPPFIKNLKEGVLLCKKCIREGMNVTIVGDYDCDGATSTTILLKGIEEYINLLHTNNNLSFIIPDRFYEGYGVNRSIIERITSGLVILVDNGIAAVEQIALAKEKGLTVIILDHHQIRDDGMLPCADIIIDPHVDNASQFKDYCGAGLAYRFVMALMPETKLESEFLALAGVGTVADVVPLVNDNRRIVIESLKRFNEGTVPYPFMLLCKALGLRQGSINEGDFGFRFGPCINAMGRMEVRGGERITSFLLAKEPKSLQNIELLEREAYEIVQMNLHRQDVVLDAMNVAYSLLEETTSCIVLSDDTVFHKGIVGIVAGKMTEKYQVPSFVFAPDTKDENNLTGSARSPEGVHLKKLLDDINHKYKGIFVGYGGHAGAAGLTIKKDNLALFKEAVKEQLSERGETVVRIGYDLEISEADIPVIFPDLNRSAPYGAGNPVILFRLNNVIGIPKVIGKHNNHFKLIGAGATYLGFDLAEKLANYNKATSFDVIGELGFNDSYGKEEYTVTIVDFKEHINSDKEVDSSFASLFEL